MKIEKRMPIILNPEQLMSVKSLRNGISFCYRSAYDYDYDQDFMYINDREQMGKRIKNIFYEGLRRRVDRGEIDASQIKTLKPYIEACIQGGRDKISLMRSGYVQNELPKMMRELDQGIYTFKMSNNPKMMAYPNIGAIVTADFGLIYLQDPADIEGLDTESNITSPCIKFSMSSESDYSAVLIFDVTTSESNSDPFGNRQVQDVSALYCKKNCY